MLPLSEQKKICEAASTAPWRVDDKENLGRRWPICLLGAGDTGHPIVTTNNVRASELEGTAEGDAQFIAQARTQWPELIEWAERARKILQSVKDNQGHVKHFHRVEWEGLNQLLEELPE